MFRIGRDELIMNFDNNEHDANSILCFNYGEIDCRCHIQKQINLGNNENEIINNLIDTYFKSIKKNIKTYKKIVIIAIIPATYQNDYEKNYGPITHKHPFVGTDNDRIRYTYKMNKTIQKYCEIYNFIYFDPFLYYKRNDGSLNHDLSDRMVHLGNNQYFLDKFYSNILLDYEILHYQRACIDLNTNKLYIEQIPEIYKDNFYEYERIHIKNYIDDIKNEPNFKIDNMEYNIYKFDNVVSYNYEFCHPEIIINRINKPLKNNITYYFIYDCPGLDAFAHWFYESFIFFQFLEKLNESYSNIKILTTNKKRYVSNLFKFVNIKNEIVYKIENSNNICFIPPLSSLNYNLLNNYFIENLINRIELNIINFKCENKILFMPRNIKDNYFPDDKIPLHLLRERRNQDEINYISDGVIKNGGVVLNTYDINNFFLQFSIVANSTNIIIDVGSSYMVNCLALKNKNIIILNSSLILIHIEIPSVNQLHNIMEKNNKITILTEYNNYEDISKYII